MTRPSTLLFDLDGTLVDTAPDFVATLNRQRQRHGLPPLAKAIIRPHVTFGARGLMELGFGLRPEDPDYPALHAELLDLYEEELARASTLFPGMAGLLEWLEDQRIPWGVVTNKPRRFTVPLLERLGLGERVAVTVCPDDVARPKPDAESIHLACDQLRLEPGTGLYMGDHERDIQAGRSAGMQTIAARYGYVEDPASVESWAADLIVDDVAAVLAWLTR